MDSDSPKQVGEEASFTFSLNGGSSDQSSSTPKHQSTVKFPPKQDDLDEGDSIFDYDSPSSSMYTTAVGVGNNYSLADELSAAMNEDKEEDTADSSQSHESTVMINLGDKTPEVEGHGDFTMVLDVDAEGKDADLFLTPTAGQSETLDEEDKQFTVEINQPSGSEQLLDLDMYTSAGVDDSNNGSLSPAQQVVISPSTDREMHSATIDLALGGNSSGLMAFMLSGGSGVEPKEPPSSEVEIVVGGGPQTQEVNYSSIVDLSSGGKEKQGEIVLGTGWQEGDELVDIEPVIQPEESQSQSQGLVIPLGGQSNEPTENSLGDDYESNFSSIVNPSRGGEKISNKSILGMELQGNDDLIAVEPNIQPEVSRTQSQEHVIQLGAQSNDLLDSEITKDPESISFEPQVVGNSEFQIQLGLSSDVEPKETPDSIENISVDDDSRVEESNYSSTVNFSYGGEQKSNEIVVDQGMPGDGPLVEEGTVIQPEESQSQSQELEIQLGTHSSELVDLGLTDNQVAISVAPGGQESSEFQIQLGSPSSAANVMSPKELSDAQVTSMLTGLEKDMADFHGSDDTMEADHSGLIDLKLEADDSLVITDVIKKHEDETLQNSLLIPTHHTLGEPSSFEPIHNSTDIGIVVQITEPDTESPVNSEDDKMCHSIPDDSDYMTNDSAKQHSGQASCDIGGYSNSLTDTEPSVQVDMAPTDALLDSIIDTSDDVQMDDSSAVDSQFVEEPIVAPLNDTVSEDAPNPGDVSVTPIDFEDLEIRGADTSSPVIRTELPIEDPPTSDIQEIPLSRALDEKFMVKMNVTVDDFSAEDVKNIVANYEHNRDPRVIDKWVLEGDFTNSLLPVEAIVSENGQPTGLFLRMGHIEEGKEISSQKDYTRLLNTTEGGFLSPVEPHPTAHSIVNPFSNLEASSEVEIIEDDQIVPAGVTGTFSAPSKPRNASFDASDEGVESFEASQLPSDEQPIDSPSEDKNRLLSMIQESFEEDPYARESGSSFLSINLEKAPIVSENITPVEVKAQFAAIPESDSNPDLERAAKESGKRQVKEREDRQTLLTEDNYDLIETVAADKPEVAADEPEVAADEPEVAVDEPEVTADEPEITAYEPEVTADELEVTADEPEMIPNQSEVKPDEPEVAADEPVVTTDESQVAVDEPEVAADNPEVATAELVVAQDEPEVTADKSEIAGDEPVFIVNKLEVTVDEPEITADEPEVATDEPEVEADKPEVATDKPEVASDEPELKANELEVNDDAPEFASDELEVALDEPEVALDEPEVAPDELEVAAEEPEVAADQAVDEPEVTADKSDVAENKPEVAADELEVTGDEPEVVANKPEVGSDEAEVKADAPEAKADEPEVKADELQFRGDESEGPDPLVQRDIEMSEGSIEIMNQANGMPALVEETIEQSVIEPVASERITPTHLSLQDSQPQTTEVVEDISELSTPSTIIEEQFTPAQLSDVHSEPAPVIEEQFTPIQLSDVHSEPAPVIEEQFTPVQLSDGHSEPAPVIEEQFTPVQQSDVHSEPAPVIEEQFTPVQQSDVHSEPAPVIEHQSTASDESAVEHTPSDNLEPEIPPLVKDSILPQSSEQVSSELIMSAPWNEALQNPAIEKDSLSFTPITEQQAIYSTDPLASTDDTYLATPTNPELTNDMQADEISPPVIEPTTNDIVVADVAPPLQAGATNEIATPAGKAPPTMRKAPESQSEEEFNDGSMTSLHDSKDFFPEMKSSENRSDSMLAMNSITAEISDNEDSDDTEQEMARAIQQEMDETEQDMTSPSANPTIEELIEAHQNAFTFGGKTECEVPSPNGEEITKVQGNILVLSACYLPDRSTPNYTLIMNGLFQNVLRSLEAHRNSVSEHENATPQTNGASSDGGQPVGGYVMIYFQGGAKSSQLPKLSWLKSCHDKLNRSIKKSILHLYIVHPTFWTRTAIFWSKPFISKKFKKKLHYSRTLESLNWKVDLKQVHVPEPVSLHDITLMRVQ